MLLPIHPVDPEGRKIQQVIQVLGAGGVIAYPTDTIYGLGCDLLQPKAIERVCRIRQLDPQKALLTLICKDISQIAGYAHQIDNEVFRLLKKNLPGPFTFILRAGNQLPKTLKNRKGTIGVRMPDHRITQAILEVLQRPMLSATLRSDDYEEEYENDPEEINEHFGNLVDLVIDGGIGGRIPSTVVDCTGDEPSIIREGAGELRF
ncbi:MAG: threonylcarbamoyl-AMP synthase [Saprospirales bacterium]|nr:threonylcarbamoyl-AMP synthase [Saprospirales bacterium]MBK6904314.1 threonylcarbamoyl-AMP synthase [Saprospirales bacterium]